jgi:hypothetical protein
MIFFGKIALRRMAENEVNHRLQKDIYDMYSHHDIYLMLPLITIAYTNITVLLHFSPYH